MNDKTKRVLLLLVPGIMLQTGVLMLMFGVAHNEVSESIPAIGYWSAVRIMLVICLWRLVLSLFSSLQENR